jgi:hypothetical protein
MSVVAATLVGGGVAHADVEQTPLDPLDPVRVVSPLTIVQGDGVKIGEGTSFYPQVGLETGFVSNTFYTNDDPTPSGVLRLLVEGGIGSLSPQRLGMDADDVTQPHYTGGTIYDANAYVTYEQYLSNNDDATDQGGVGAGFAGKVIIHPQDTISFRADDRYDRVLHSLNFETNTNANRDINTLSLRLDIHPEGRRLSGAIWYRNQIDVFENSLNIYPDRLHNTLAARLSYALFPLSTAYLQVSGSYYTGIGDVAKANSYPIMALAGLSTALTVKTSLLAQAGYTQGFYQSGPDYQAFVGLLYFEYRYSPISALRLKYSYDHQDSINANFFRDHTFQGWLEHKFDPIGVYVSPELRLRQYQGINPPLMGPAVRDDVIFAAALGVRYQYRAWMSASAEYRVVDDSTDYRFTGGTAMTDPSYVRHEVFAGVRLAY